MLAFLIELPRWSVLLFGIGLGGGATVPYIVSVETSSAIQIEAERKQKREAMADAEHNRNRVRSRDVELERLRDALMKHGINWWKFPTDNIERIPPQNFPTTPKE